MDPPNSNDDNVTLNYSHKDDPPESIRKPTSSWASGNALDCLEVPDRLAAFDSQTFSRQPRSGTMRKNQIMKLREVNSNPAARRGNGTINFNVGQTSLNNTSFPTNIFQPHHLAPTSIAHSTTPDYAPRNH